MCSGSPERRVEPVGMASEDPVSELARVVDKLLAHAPALEVEQLAGMRAEMDRLEVGWARALRASERAGALARAVATPAGLVAEACRVSFGAAKRALRTGARLEALPETAAAALAGELRPDHVRVITDACTPERSAALASVEEQLVAVGRAHTARTLRGVVARVCDAIDGDDGAAAANGLHERRQVHLSATLDGVGVLSGTLDPEGTETVLAALAHHMVVADADGPEDPPRSRAQRRADALAGICREYLRHADSEPAAAAGRRGRPHVSAVVDLQLLTRTGHGELADLVRGDLDHTGAVSAATLRRLTCDANVHRVVTDGPSRPIDVGRATRSVPDRLWRALVARDGHCTAPQCDQPPGRCEAHHVVHWADGGPTDLSNLRLLCWKHHRLEHEGRPRAPA